MRKLGRILKPSGLGDVIDNPFEPSEFMEYVQALGNVKDEEAYKTWNMGQGMIIICPKNKVGDVFSIARRYEISASQIGEVTSRKGITILNRGAYNPKRSPELAAKGPELLTFNS